MSEQPLDAAANREWQTCGKHAVTFHVKYGCWQCANPQQGAVSDTGLVSQRMSVPIDLWQRLVFAAKDSDDGRFRSLMEQAIMEARPE